MASFNYEATKRRLAEIRRQRAMAAENFARSNATDPNSFATRPPAVTNIVQRPVKPYINDRVPQTLDPVPTSQSNLTGYGTKLFKTPNNAGLPVSPVAANRPRLVIPLQTAAPLTNNKPAAPAQTTPVARVVANRPRLVIPLQTAAPLINNKPAAPVRPAILDKIRPAKLYTDRVPISTEIAQPAANTLPKVVRIIPAPGPPSVSPPVTTITPKFNNQPQQPAIVRPQILQSTPRPLVDANSVNVSRPTQNLPSQAVGGYTKVAGSGKGYTVLINADGVTERRTGSRAWRNNNPGNIRYGSFAKKNGAIGNDGGFAVFSDYEAGRAAKQKLLFGTNSYKNLTIEGAIKRYAPPDENNTRSYVQNVVQKTGLNPRAAMNSLNPEQQNLFMDAIQSIEGFEPGQASPARARTRTGSPAIDVQGDAPRATAVPPRVTERLADRYRALAGSDDVNIQTGLKTLRRLTAGGDDNLFRVTEATRRDIEKRLGITGNDPLSQNALALALLDRRGGLKALQDGDFRAFIRAAGDEWGQIPGSRYNRR